MSKQTTATKAHSTAAITATVYCGPEYKNGIQLPGSHEIIRPKDFTSEEVAEFIALHPQYADWWAIASVEPTDAPPTE